MMTDKNYWLYDRLSLLVITQQVVKIKCNYRDRQYKLILFDWNLCAGR